ncbi:MAG: tyrosine-type recombinase/integrase [Planctomycetota bacterium]|jgi:hypothetical protein
MPLLRHTFITNLAKSGVHPKMAQSLARHSSIELTMHRYTHTTLETQAEALEKLPDFIELEEQARHQDGHQDSMTGTDDPAVLVRFLPFSGRKHDPNCDKMRQQTQTNFTLQFVITP